MLLNMSKQTVKDEVKEISLTQSQKDTVNNHFDTVRDVIHEEAPNLKVTKQGSFGRGTVIKGQESDGFDLDVAILIPSENYQYYEYQNFANQLIRRFANIYNGPTQNVELKKKSIAITTRSNFHIDVTFIYRDGYAVEDVYNFNNHAFEASFALAFKEAFRTKNENSFNNALQDLAKIYKQIRDAVDDPDIEKIPSIVIEMLLYNAYRNSDNYANSMIATLKNMQIYIDNSLVQNYRSIPNPCHKSDRIPTKIESIQALNKFSTLNTLVIKTIEQAVTKGYQFHKLARKFEDLQQLDKSLSDGSVISSNDNVIGSGVFGGNEVDKDKFKF